MKKFLSAISLMIAALMILAIPSVSAKQSIDWELPEDITTYYANNISGKTPTIDGIIDENEYGANFVRIDSPRAVTNSSWGDVWETGTVREGLASEYMDFYFAYDENNIYIAVYDLGPEHIDNGDAYEINDVMFRSNYRFMLGFDMENVANYFQWDGFRTQKQWPTLSYYDGSMKTSNYKTYDLVSDCVVRKVDVNTGEPVVSVDVDTGEVEVAVGNLTTANGNLNYYKGQWAVTMEFKLTKATVIEMWNEHFNTEYKDLSDAMWIGLTTNGYRSEGGEYEKNSDGSLILDDDGNPIESYYPLYNQYYKWLGLNDISGKQDDYVDYGVGFGSTRDSLFDVVVFGEEGSDIFVADPFPPEEEETEPEDETDDIGADTNPEETQPVADNTGTNAPETNGAEETTAANNDEVTTAKTETKAPETTEAAEEKSGCGSSVSVAGIALVAALGTCTVFVAKKKED